MHIPDISPLDFVTSGICIIDSRFTVVFWNKRLETWTGKKRNEVAGLKLWEVFPGFQQVAYQKRLSGLFSGGPPVVLSSELNEHLFMGYSALGDKAVQQAVISAYPVKDEYYALFSIDDITAQAKRIFDYRCMRDKAKKALEDNEILLREMNHRIHNNLNMVLSLIELQIEESGELEGLKEVERQINAVRLVHENLYQSEDALTVESRAYLEGMIDSITAFFPNASVDMDIEIEKIDLNTRKAVPLGLIVNEIIVNALKHGFPPGTEGTIHLRMNRKGGAGDIVLIISNDGLPFPADKNLDNSGSLGLRLITALADQLEGNIELTKEPYPEYVLRFSDV